MSSSCNNILLSLNAEAIRNGFSKFSIPTVLGKDKSMNGKEIKLHRVPKHNSPLHSDCSIRYEKYSYDPKAAHLNELF